MVGGAKVLVDSTIKVVLACLYINSKLLGGPWPPLSYTYANGKANGKEYFGESDDRSSVVSLCLQVLAGKIVVNCASFAKFTKSFPLQYFPTYGSYHLL